MTGLGTLINTGGILAGGLAGLVFGKFMTARYQDTLTSACGLCVIFIGIAGTIEKMMTITDGVLSSSGTMMVIGSFTAGSLLGEFLNIEHHLESFGNWLKARTGNSGDAKFVEGFVTATILYCVGAMAINGSIEAGLNHSYGVLISKSVLDGISSITFAAAMGVGVTFSTIPIFVYEGALVLLAGAVGPYLGEAVVTEMSAVGGAIIVGIAINMMGLSESKFRVGNMLPAIFLPILYLPLSQWLGSLMA